MKSYSLYKDRVEFSINISSTFTIYFNENSGKVYFRYKNGSMSGMKDPGIFLGVDVNGNGYFLHNHNYYGKAHISHEIEFRKNTQIFTYKEKWSNEPLKAIEQGLNEMLRGASYNPISFNMRPPANNAIYYQETSEYSAILLIVLMLVILILYSFN